MTLWTLALALISLPFSSALSGAEPEMHWVQAGFALIRRLDCDHVGSMLRGECTKMRLSPVSRFTAYIAREPVGSRLVVSHPEEEEEKTEVADAAEDNGEQLEALKALLVLDPLADRAFGHPVFVFRVVSLNTNRPRLIQHCSRRKGLVYENVCIYQQMKRNCPEESKRHPVSEFPSSVAASRGGISCEFQFLPHVSTTNSTNNALHCFPHSQPCTTSNRLSHRQKRLYRRRVLPREYRFEGRLGWGRRPQWLSSQQTRLETRDTFLPHRPTRSASVGKTESVQSFVSPFPTHPSPPPPLPHQVDEMECSNYNRCDHAILLTGSPRRGHLIDKLRSLGFTPPYISEFLPVDDLSRGPTAFHSSRQGITPRVSLKSGFRAKLQRLCHTPRCVSSLFLYLNNFVLPNGDMLLGTHGTNSTLERYTPDEFLQDISGCQASLVFAVVDQNFGGIILEGLRAQPSNFDNLVLLSATRQSGITTGDDTVVASSDVATQPMTDLFYGAERDLRLLHFEVYGVEGLLTFALVNLPLTRLGIGDVQQQIKQFFPVLKLGSFYGGRVDTHRGSLFSKPILTNHHTGGFLQGHASRQSRTIDHESQPTHHMAGCVSLSPIDWLRNYLPSASIDQT